MGLLTFISKDLATRVGNNLGIKPVRPQIQVNHSFPADANLKNYQSREIKMSLKKSDKLSMFNTIKNTIKTRQIGFLLANGADGKAVNN